MFDLKRQKAFLVNPRAGQSKKITATIGATAITKLILFMMRERKCTTDLQNSIKTRPSY